MSGCVTGRSAAGESDVLFCKLLPSSNNDLAKHCLKESVPFVPFYTFTEVRMTRGSSAICARCGSCARKRHSSLVACYSLHVYRSRSTAKRSLKVGSLCRSW